MTIVAVVLVLVMVRAALCSCAPRVAQRQLPRSGEVWTQNGQILYVIKVERDGGRLRLGGTTQRDKWTESWATWALRAQRRVILRTIRNAGCSISELPTVAFFIIYPTICKPFFASNWIAQHFVDPLNLLVVDH